MSIGNTKDQGNKENNYPYQRAVLQLLDQIANSGGGGSVVLTPTIARVTSSGTISAGKKSISIYNSGLADATVLTVIVKPGETYTWSTNIKGETLAAVAYNATGTELVITTL